ncbi:electron transfer flavoprotein alpha subunit apoprotein [Desulfocicer vacuolatum DSM 3385]|uniref:Electron transfer flavoprotein subunit alpha n=1 Tax=Desulfocicer vacuolatum DSM 3385 TaxID=1121400 RepID=A0A1W2AJW7_9BACT|nr:electron transfer flavoprotein subunit alpha/FixB family protein [Desulfocicer vacuolatum]SMC60967.1 electron transfer flavoprotein alpha subunit apoprotein [Desulfocicer vacuolatum DSM 3385]
MAQGVMVVAELFNGSFKKVSLEALSKGKALADSLGESLVAVVMGAAVSEPAKELAKYGADLIVVAQDADLEGYRPCQQHNVLVDIINDKAPRMVLFGATRQGKELSANVSATLDVGLAQECLDLFIEDQKLVAKRTLFGGKIIATVDIEGDTQLATIRPNVFEITEATGAGVVEECAVNLGTVNVTLIEEKVEVSSKIELTEADYIVSGGRAMDGPDFSILENLAATLGGAVGASRNAVDAGWRPQTDQVGQTGKVVSPKLYIACGISGAMQHIAGMSTSDVIVAINNDPDALIFKTSDYSIVDDLFDVVPAITEEIKKLA